MAELLKKDKNNQKNWRPTQDEAFERMKLLLISAPVLVHPGYRKPFKVFSDASDVGIGGCLLQTWAGEERTINYFSRRLKKAEKNYARTEKETLALVESLEGFRIFIFGYHVDCFVD